GDKLVGVWGAGGKGGGVLTRQAPGGRGPRGNRGGGRARPSPPPAREPTKPPPATTRDGCISDFVNPAVVNCTYGDLAATRTIALAGGAHAEHWLPPTQLRGTRHHFQVATDPKIGGPLTIHAGPRLRRRPPIPP